MARASAGAAVAVGVLAAGCMSRGFERDPVGPTAAEAVRAAEAAPAALERQPSPLEFAADPLAFAPSPPASDFVLASDGQPPPPPTELAPPVRVYGERPASPYVSTVPRAPTSESDLVGPNRQPEWTTHRRFATTRAYVLAPWQVEFESWWRGTWKKDDTEQHRFLEEIGIGLPHRFQVDLYWRIQSETDEETTYKDFQVEGRWALAPWGCLPLNPTLYAEYKFIDEGSDVWEAKVLFAEDFGRCQRWHWAGNLSWEEETSGEKERELAVTTAVSYTIADSKFSVGAEAMYAAVSVDGARDDPEQEVFLGPSFQWRPTNRTHLDVTPLFGLTDESPDFRLFIVFGIDLFKGTAGHSTFAPTSARGW